LLWSVKNFNLKLRISQVLQGIINRQYLLQYSIGQMVVDRLINEFNQPFLTSYDYSGCLIGIVCLGSGSLILSDDFLSSICCLPDSIKDSCIMKEAVSFFLYNLKEESMYTLSYDKLGGLVDNFYSGDSIIQYRKPICCVETGTSDSQSHIADSACVPTASVMSYNTLKREIDLLLHGHTIDDLTSSSCELDDMPPILFRKSSIQPQLSTSKYTVEDMGFITKQMSTSRSIKLIINGVTAVENAPRTEKPVDSEFYNAFQRCHQFIVNSKTIKIFRSKSNFNQKKSGGPCAMHYLFYFL